MTYHVVLRPSAEKELARLPQNAYELTAKKLLALQENPRPVGVKKLAGRDGYRVRVGDYRILYAIDDGAHCVTVLAIRHRREAYR